MEDKSILKDIPLAELHTHLGFSVSPTMLWEIAHNQGLKLPTKNYWEFEKMVTMYETKPYEEYLMLYDLTEKIQSSPEALFTASETAVSGAYRKNNITLLELRFNPILRARGGERDLDHLIVFALQGMERAMLKYPVKVGLILMMDRRFTHHENEAIVKKAVKYKNRGVVGVDLAGPVKRNDNAKTFSPSEIIDICDYARSEELGLTVHTGEATDTEEMWQVVKLLKPQRIGHGIACVNDRKLMDFLSENNIVLETCPTSNLNTRLIKDYDQMRKIYRTLIDNNVLFTISTDGPEMQLISLREEYRRLILNKILTEEQLLEANKTAFQATFIERAKEDNGKFFL